MVYLFLGTDDYLKRKGAEAVIAEFVPESERDFGLEVLDAQCDVCAKVLDVLQRAREALYTESFFGGGKVVWLKEANFLPGAKGQAVEAQAAKEAVSAFCELIQQSPAPEGHHLVITARTCSASSRFYKWIAQQGKVQACGAEVRSYQLEKVALERLAQFLPESHVQMAPAVQRAFVQRVGADSWTQVSELEKLRTYLGQDGAQASLQDVEAVTSPAVEVEPFELSNAILQRSPTRLVEAIALLSSNKNAAFPAVASVLNLLNDLCALREALGARLVSAGRWSIPPEQIPTRLARLQGWAFNRLAEGAERYTLNELRAARHYAVEMRFKMVDSTQQEPWAIVEPVLLRIVSRSLSAVR